VNARAFSFFETGLRLPIPRALVRHVAFPIHERLVGRETPRCVDELEESQWFDRQRILRLQERKLSALFRHAARHTSFYRRRFLSSGLSAQASHPLDQLGQFPLLSKDDIRATMSDMLWHSSPGGLFAHNTGGSTGEPLQFFVDRRRQAYDQAARIRTHRWFGVDLGHRELLLWGSPIEHRRADGVRRLRDRCFNQKLINAFDMSAGRMNEYMAIWNRFRPHCLFGYPSGIALFAEHVRLKGRRLNTSSLRAVFVTGEVCFPHDRELISSVFQVPVADGYGSREAGFIAHECPNGRMHITAENVIVEIVENGLAQPDGRIGEIVVTHLDAYGMPFIRYRTGDVGRLLAAPCPCGRGLPVMDVVQGRSTDFLRLPDGTARHALSIIYPLRELSSVRQFRVTQHEDYSLTVDVVPARGASMLEESVIAEAVQPIVGEDVPVSINLVEQLPSSSSGKHRYVTSRVKHPSV
jgi:phenylacetate-CoA ligase